MQRCALRSVEPQRACSSSTPVSLPLHLRRLLDLDMGMLGSAMANLQDDLAPLLVGRQFGTAWVVRRDLRSPDSWLVPVRRLLPGIPRFPV
jgi:hypothetical protein